MSSSLGGGLTGLTVTVTTAGGVSLPAVLTTTNGAYSVASVPQGTGSVTVTGQPALCTSPPVATYTLTADGATTANVTVPCSAPTATIIGTVTSSLVGHGVIAGATITVTPHGSSALPAVVTDANGSYIVGGIPIAVTNGVASTGAGSVALGAPLPPGCVAPASVAYSGLKPDSVLAVRLVAPCTGGTLTISLTEPSDFATLLTLHGPGPDVYVPNPFVRSTQTLVSVPPGSYTVVLPQYHYSGDTVLSVSASGTVSGSPATVTPGGSATISVVYVQRPGTGLLWMTSAAGASAYTPTALAQSGTSAGTVPSPAGGAQAIAFDSSGNLWMTAGASVEEYVAAVLPLPTGTYAPPGGPSRTFVLPGGPAVAAGLAFDKQQNLWVADIHHARIYQYAASDLAGSGTTSPRITIATAGASGVTPFLQAPRRLAFDANGDLWVADTLAHCALMYSATQLASGGAPVPYALSTIGMLPGGGPYAIAIDAFGQLWAGGATTEGPPGLDSGRVVAYQPLPPATGTPTGRLAIGFPAASFGSSAGSARPPVMEIALANNFDVWVLGNNQVGYYLPIADQGLGHYDSGTTVRTLNLETGLAFDVAPTNLPLVGGSGSANRVATGTPGAGGRVARRSAGAATTRRIRR